MLLKPSNLLIFGRSLWFGRPGQLLSLPLRSLSCSSKRLLDDSAQAISGTTEVEQAVRLVCTRLGRTFGPPEAHLCQKLQENWYQTAADLAVMPENEAASLGVPSRLRTTLLELLREGKAGAAHTADTAATIVPAVHPEPEAALVRELDAASESEEPNVLDVAAQAASMLEAFLVQGDEAERQMASGAASTSGRPAGEGGTAAGLFCDIPIEERKCPKLSRFNNKYADVQKVSRRGRPEAYAIKVREMAWQLGRHAC